MKAFIALFLAISIISPLSTHAKQPVTRSNAPDAPKGLDGRNIAMWQSHGRYYNIEKGEWLWQRAHLMQTIEDLYSASYVIDLLVPMLENAGAYVMLPRERDLNNVEVIIDADASTTSGYNEVTGTKKWRDADVAGFAMPDSALTDRQNPFEMGSTRMVSTVTSAKSASTATWNAAIPHDGVYTIYISYATLPNSSSAVKYTVNSRRGEEVFTVDQTMGGGTWIRLGEFPLAEGVSDVPIVTVSNVADAQNAGKAVTADAVRIGGGMGNVARGEVPTTSGLPRWLEGSRYWLQWSGAPVKVYSETDYEDDYRDDIFCRPNWVNWLAGGSARHPKEKGLNIPVDIAFALHTDAGTTPDSTIVGSLSIYCTDRGSRLGDGRRRTASRQLAEQIHNSVVEDMRELHEPLWNSRRVRNRRYIEARVPAVPSALLELLSHQNFSDMRLGQDPQFRFDAARAIYKGILRYFYGKKGGYVVQPLPVRKMLITNRGNGNYRLSWEATVDSLESTAQPTAYYIEMAKGVDDPFVTVAKVTNSYYDFKADEATLYSLRVVAANAGGVSFPSEVLSMCRYNNDRPEVLIVNGFTRVSAPDWFETEAEAGFLDEIDHGVPYMRNIAYSGAQYNFDRESPWVDDVVEPGFGASYSAYDGRPVAGNTFDYPRIHGAAIMNARYSFVSSSLEAYLEGSGNTKQLIIDLILGKQREIQPKRFTDYTRFKTFPANLQKRLAAHCRNGGSLLVSGSYIASDLYANPYSNDSTMQADINFAREVLGIDHESAFAAIAGKVSLYPFWANRFQGTAAIQYSATPNERLYVVESPDAIAPSGRGVTMSIAGYDENGMSAAVASRHNRSSVITLGIPFESIFSTESKNSAMAQFLKYLNPLPPRKFPRGDFQLPVDISNGLPEYLAPTPHFPTIPDDIHY